MVSRLDIFERHATNGYELLSRVRLGSAGQKGTVMGILRSLGALARALGPIFTSTRKYVV